MLFLNMILVILMMMICLISTNYIIWWSVFLMMTIFFISLNKSLKSYSSMLNYFIIQESLGLMFLIFNVSILQFFIVLMKIGVALLHFWIFNVTNNVFGLNLMWFLTFQKLLFLFVIMQIFWFSGFLLLMVGLLMCYIQMLTIKNYKNLMILSSTESFNWIILGVLMSIFNSMYLFFYYFILMLFLINKFSKLSNNFVEWETILVFLNILFSVTFFVKIFSLSEIFKVFDVYILFLLMMMFLSVLSFSYWLINISMKSIDLNQFFNKTNVVIFLLMMLVCIL